MSMLLQPIEQSLDTFQFKDSCRALLGEAPGSCCHGDAL